MKKIILFMAIISLSLGSISAIANEPYRVINSLHSHDFKETDETYEIIQPFEYKNKEYNIDVFVEKDLDQTIVLYNDLKKDMEVFKVTIDHREDGEFEFYGYESITGEITLKDENYQFTMNDGKKELSNFKIKTLTTE